MNINDNISAKINYKNKNINNKLKTDDNKIIGKK
jgi:hypothetical protein